MLCLELCFNFTVFCSKTLCIDKFFWAPMGSCISPVVAYIFMAYVEKTAVNTFHKSRTIVVRFTCNSLHTIFRHHKLSVARGLHNRFKHSYCRPCRLQSSHVKQTPALNGYPRKYFCGQQKITDR